MRKSTLLISLSALVFVLIAAFFLMQSLKPRQAMATDNRYAEARTLWFAEDYDAAQAILDDVVSSDSSNLDARVLRADIISRTDAAAGAALLEGILPDELSDEARANAVTVYIRADNEARARAMLGPVSDETPLGPELSLAHAKIALRYDKAPLVAREALENVLRTAPNLIEAKQLLARLLFEIGDVLDQVRAKSLARELDKKDRLPLALLGRMLFTENSPFFEEEVIYYGQRLLEHPDFESSPFYGNLEFYRVTSRRFKAAGRVDLAFEMERARRQHPDATLQDVVSYVDIAMQTGRLDIVNQEMPDLARQAPENPQVDILFAAKANLEGDEPAVIRYIRQAMDKGNGKDTLVEAIRYVGLTKRFTPSLENEIAKLMLDTEGMASGDVLVAANTVLQTLEDPTEIRKIIDEVKVRYADQPAILATWLRTRGLPEESLEEAQRVLDSGNVRVLPLVLDLQCEMGNVEEAERLFRQYGDQLEEFSHDVMDIRLAMARDDAAKAGTVWDSAWARAQRNENFQEMVALCHLSVAMQDYHRLLRSYDPLIANGVGLRKDEFIFLANQEVKRGRPAEARKVLDQATVFYPNDTDLVNDRSYLSILIGQGDYRIIDTMEELVKGSPDNSYYRFTLALAYLVNEFRGEAMETIEPIDFVADQFPNASRAIYAAVLWANGHQGPAQLVLNKIESDKLLREEKDILEPYLGKL